MASTRELRRRIRSARATKQITRAQEMIAAARLRPATQAALSSREYSEKLGCLISNLLCSNQEPLLHPWLTINSHGPKLIIALASDQGLAGAFQGNLLRAAVRIHEQDSTTLFLPIGKRLASSLHRLNYPLLLEEVAMPRQPSIEDAKKISELIGGLLLAGKISGATLLTTQYKTTLIQEVHSSAVLPIPILTTVGGGVEALYEPSPNAVLAALLPQFLTATIYTAFLESKASEYASRRTAMHAATDNADDLISRLTLTYNRVRQAAITTEIAEIVGGAAALTN